MWTIFSLVVLTGFILSWWRDCDEHTLLNIGRWESRIGLVTTWFNKLIFPLINVKMLATCNIISKEKRKKYKEEKLTATELQQYGDILGAA